MQIFLEKFVDTTAIIDCRESTKNRSYNDKIINDKRTNHYIED